MVEAKSMPPRIVWAIDRLAKALASEGYASATVTVSERQPSRAGLTDSLGYDDFYRYDGAWFLVEDGDGE